jgi:kinesin family member 5
MLTNCSQVVELEISLDETREQYNNVLRSSNNRQQQKKMAFLERNLEQLTTVQRQLVDQNSSLKKEVAIAERKLIARNERIQSLEALLQDSQEKLTAANHRYVLVLPALWEGGFLQPITLAYVTNICTCSFETQLQAVKDRLEAAKQGSTRGLGSPTNTGASFAFGNTMRIAKPLRGGGGAAGGGQEYAQPPVLSSLQQQEGQASGKRSSWFFNQRS